MKQLRSNRQPISSLLPDTDTLHSQANERMKSSRSLSMLMLLASLTITRLHAFVTAPLKIATPSFRTSNLQMTILSYNGKKKDFKPGTPLSTAVQQLGLKPTYSCKKGDCATCQIFLAGRATKPCVAKVPEAPKLKSLQEKGLEIRS
ncbi:hypothetical protein IV203_017160 [Nitzschia inconspicua]|uniref:Ferredoxin n=1 Tax=Nitzschia inconspicua TaxID=303405 RepID=A0A9K3KRE6_9STRA|nr:hypothetical protein IV203_017160 [Nitzschia inconspicua]